MTHQCLACYEDTDRYILVQRGPFVHGFSMCYSLECMYTFRMWLDPRCIVIRSMLWE